MKIETLKNSFHNTSIRILGGFATWDHLQMLIFTGRATNADKARLRRIEKALCGYADCCCGTVRG